MKMRAIRFNFLMIVGLVLTFGVSSAMAMGDDSGKKRPKDMGTLSIRTTEEAYPVRINGVERGMTGVGKGAEYFLTPGFHTVEVMGPNGKVWKQQIEIRRGQKNCVCLKIVRETISRPCPYNFALDGPGRINEGDLVTYAAINSGTTPIPIKYAWTVANGVVKSGLGTPTITVDSTGMGGKTINAVLDVNDDVYDNKCRQVIAVPTDVIPPNIVVPKAFICDEFESRSADDDKARFDNCAIQVQNMPEGQLHIFIYPGTDRVSTTRNTYERLSKRMLDYMVKDLRVDPKRITLIKASNRAKTTYQMWIVPAGAELPKMQ